MKTLTELMRDLESGQTSARAHAEEVIAAAETQAGLGAVLALDPDQLRRAADTADARRCQGRARPLEGLIIGAKDNIDTADLPTTGGTGAFSGPAAEHAPALQRLLDQGMICGAKLNLHELAFGITNRNQVTGAVHNPWRRGLIPGGSSGGSAAAVAAGIVPASLGTDTGGSVRVPAALCGLAGLRPTTGRYPAGGVVPLSQTRDTLGPIARSVADLALLDAALAADRDTLATWPAKGLRIGLPRRVLWEDLEPGVAARCEEAVEALANAGAVLVEADPADLWEDGAAASFTIVFGEFLQELSTYAEGRGVSLDQLIRGIGSPDVRPVFEAHRDGPGVSDALYHQAIHTRLPRMRRTWAAYFETHDLDAALFPTTPLTARPIGQDDTVDLNGRQVPTFATFIRNSEHGSLIGAPGVTVPVGLSDGLPVGIELSSLPGSDRALLGIAATLERLLPPMPSCPAFSDTQAIA